MSKPEDLVMTGRMPLTIRFPEIDMFERLKSLGLVKEESGPSIAKTIILKEAIMAKAQASMEVSGGLPDSLVKKGFKIFIPFVKSVTGLWVSPEHLPKEEEVVPVIVERQPEVAAAPAPEEIVEEVAPAAERQPVIAEEKKKENRAAWIACGLMLLLLFFIGWKCYKDFPVPVQQVQNTPPSTQWGLKVINKTGLPVAIINNASKMPLGEPLGVGKGANIPCHNNTVNLTFNWDGGSKVVEHVFTDQEGWQNVVLP